MNRDDSVFWLNRCHECQSTARPMMGTGLDGKVAAQWTVTSRSLPSFDTDNHSFLSDVVVQEGVVVKRTPPVAESIIFGRRFCNRWLTLRAG